jgi:hypothetical protein
MNINQKLAFYHLRALCTLKNYSKTKYASQKLLVPRDDDGIFCGGFDYAEEETTLIDLRIFVTTKRLLSHMRISRRESECILFKYK